jgi:DNA-binding LacI/PurR family transcriptional regulator
MASVICGWDDFVLDFTVPPITRYRIDPDVYGRKAAELLLKQIRHGVGKIKEIGLMPELISGGTLGACR